MSIVTYLRAILGVPLNASQFDANITNLAEAIEDLSVGHDHDGVNSKKDAAVASTSNGVTFVSRSN